MVWIKNISLPPRERDLAWARAEISRIEFFGWPLCIAIPNGSTFVEIEDWL